MSNDTPNDSILCSRLYRTAGLLCALVSLLAHTPTPAEAESWDNSISNEWIVEIGARSDASPALAPDGTIFVGTFDGRFWAISPTGKRKWMFRAGGEIQSSPAVGEDGTIYFGCRDRKFYALGSDGKQKWVFATGAWNDSSPAIGDGGTIYFGSWDKFVYALNPDGSKKWQFQTGAEVVSSPAINRQGRICLGSHDRKLYAFEANGTKAWEFLTEGPIISSPAVDLEGNLYFTSVDGCLYAVRSDGTLRWRLRTGGITESSPVIGFEGMLYVGVNKKIWAVSLDGVKKSEQEATSDEYQLPVEASPVALADGSLLVISRYGLLLNRKQMGPAKWNFFLYGYGPASPAVSPSGTIYAAGTLRKFYALPSGVALAHTPWPKFRGNARNTGNAAAGSQ